MNQLAPHATGSLALYDRMCTAIAECVAVDEAKDIRDKALWVAQARAEFSPGPQRPCEICGRHQSVAQAHHVVPLALQFDCGAQAACHDSAWLCPTHHAAVHLLIAQANGQRKKASRNVIALIGELSDADELRPVLALVERSANARLQHADALEAWGQGRAA